MGSTVLIKTIGAAESVSRYSGFADVPPRSSATVERNDMTRELGGSRFRVCFFGWHRVRRVTSHSCIKNNWNETRAGISLAALAFLSLPATPA
jgi:hypothetical protein